MSKYWFCKVDRHPNMIYRYFLDEDHEITHSYLTQSITSYLAFENKKIRDTFVQNLPNVVAMTKHDIIAQIGRFDVIENVCVSVKRDTNGLEVLDDGLCCIYNLQHWLLHRYIIDDSIDNTDHDILLTAADQIKHIR